ncbi:MAG: hypothetical protein AAGG57_12050 [Pseudomonadota bacterium]
MHRITLTCLLIFWSGGALAQDHVDRLITAMRVPELVEIISKEGMQGAKDLDADMLGGAGGAVWLQQARQIYSPMRLKALISSHLSDHYIGTDVEAALLFLESDLGQWIVQLEVDARIAIMDPDVEAAARRIAEENPPPMHVTRYIEINDLVELNVQNALQSDLRFAQGLVAGGMEGLSEEDMLSDTWASEPAYRADIVSWLQAYVTLALSPMEDQDIETYLAFCETDVGQRLNRAIFRAYGAAYEDVSFALGQAAALFLTEDEI